MRFSYLFIAILIVLGQGLNAQLVKELSPAMSAMLKEYEGQTFSTFIAGDIARIADIASSEEIKVIGSAAGYHLVHTSAAALEQLVAIGALHYIGLSASAAEPLNDQMIGNNNILPVHLGIFPLDSALTGQGVIMGVVDTGVELAHPDFQHEDGTTRILELWDHTFEFDEAHVPEDYGFGTRWVKEEIDAGVAQHVDQAQWNGHGSTVTGTACGDGSAVDNYKGAAPNTDMVIVSFDFARPDFLADVAQAVQYIFEIADERGQAAVVNLSLGDYYGSHDGLDPAALYIDSLLDAHPGRIAVAAAGNSNSIAPYHLRTDIVNDSSFTWFESENSLALGSGGVFFELWAEESEFSGIEFQMAADKTSGGYSARGTSPWKNYSDALGAVDSEAITNDNGDTLAIAQYWSQLRGDQVQLQVYLQDPDSSSYDFRFMTRGTGGFDIWSTSVFGTSDMVQGEDLPDEAEFPPIAMYKSPDREKQIVSSFTCSEKVVTVGNYTNRISYTNILGEATTINGTTGEIYISSSAGPTRDGRVKPDVAATGSLTLSSGNFPMLEYLIANEPHKVAPGGMHFRNGGTSMASPVVAGVAALYLEQCPEATYADFKADLLANAAVDAFVGQVPDVYWGMGKLNAYATIASHSIIVEIDQVGDSLQASGADSYQWYLDGQALDGAVSSTILLQGDGVYTVEGFNASGCSRLSAPFLFTTLNEVQNYDIQVSPNPATDRVFLDGLPAGARCQLFDSYGRAVIQYSTASTSRHVLDVADLSAGLYILQVDYNDDSKRYRLVKD